MPACKACGEWFAKTRDAGVLCSKCEMALGRLAGYAVPVVRCKDCKWDKPDRLLNKHWCSRFLGSMEVRGDDFCSYGGRKEEQ